MVVPGDRKRSMTVPGVTLFAAGSLLIVVALLMGAADAYAASHYSGLSQAYSLRGLLADLGLPVPSPTGVGFGDWLLSGSAVKSMLVTGLVLLVTGGILFRCGSGRARRAR